MNIQRIVAAFLVLAFAAGLRHGFLRPVRSEFEDIPVPKGLAYQPQQIDDHRVADGEGRGGSCYRGRWRSRA